jgi:hypothetical protein
MSTAIGIPEKLPVPRAEPGAASGAQTRARRSAARPTNGLAAGAGRPGGRVFRVAPETHEQLQRRISTLGRRARGLWIEPVRLIDTGERDAGGHALVLLAGHAPVLAGWTLPAIVDHRDGHATVRPVGEESKRLAACAFAAASLRALWAAPPAHRQPAVGAGQRTFGRSTAVGSVSSGLANSSAATCALAARWGRVLVNAAIVVEW